MAEFVTAVYILIKNEYNFLITFILWTTLSPFHRRYDIVAISIVVITRAKRGMALCNMMIPGWRLTPNDSLALKTDQECPRTLGP